MVQNNAYFFQKNAKDMNNSYTKQVKIATLDYAAQPVAVYSCDSSLYYFSYGPAASYEFDLFILVFMVLTKQLQPCNVLRLLQYYRDFPK